MKAAALLAARGPAAALEVLDAIRSSDEIVLRTTYLLRTIVLVLLDRQGEAKMEMAKLRAHDPTWTLAKHRRRFFYSAPDRLKPQSGHCRSPGCRSGKDF